MAPSVQYQYDMVTTNAEARIWSSCVGLRTTINRIFSCQCFIGVDNK